MARRVFNGARPMPYIQFRFLLSLAILTSLLAAPQSGNAQAAKDETNRGAATVLVFDVSNSMWGQVEGRSKIEIAREVIADLLDEWNPDADLGLVAYGHRRAGDCGDIEQVLPIAPVDPRRFSDVVNSLVPRGKTPLTAAVREAAEILNYTDSPATVILVSDGIESCNADPCALAEELERGGIDFTAHVVGFDVARIEDQRQLSCLADTTGGQFLTAETAGELLDALRTVAAPPPPMLRLEAIDRAAGAPLTDPNLRWTVVALDREETILSGEAMARPELEVGAGRYFARAELGDRAGSIEFDYAGDDDALHQVVLAVLVRLDAPEEAEASNTVSVFWTGPDAPGDFIALAEPGAAATSFVVYARTSAGSPAKLDMPETPGDYELRYVDAASGRVMAELPIRVVGAAATLEAPPVVEAGSAFEVTWTGPENDGDFITIVPADADEGSEGNYAYTRKGSPANMTAPDKPGAYELRYVSRLSRKSLARLPITVTPASATLEAPPAIGAGAAIEVAWTGPDNQNDFITIVPAGEKEGNYTYTRKGSPLEVKAPDEPGGYELRYVTGQSSATLARLPISVTEVSASLEAPPAIGAGAAIEVAWTGPDNQNDFITIVSSGEKEGTHGNYTYTRKGSPLEVRAPDEPGNYELRYVTGQSSVTIARLPIAVTAVSATLDAPPAIGAGAAIEISWIGPDNQNDFITIVPANAKEGTYGDYTYTRKGTPLEVRAPDEPGSYELRYVSAQSNVTLAVLPITVTAVSATLGAPPLANAGAGVEVSWTGPDNQNDFVTVVVTGEKEGKHGNYTYTRKGNPLVVRMPETPGSYELRYVTGQSKQTLVRLPITLAPVAATLEAAPVVAAGSMIQVDWSGPDNQNDLIAIARPDQDNRQTIAYTYTRNGSPLEVRAPKEKGAYELRYLTAQDKNILARLPITVN